MPIGLSCFPLCFGASKAVLCGWSWGKQLCLGRSELHPSSTSQPRYQPQPRTRGRGALPVQLMPSLSQIAGTICASPT